MRRLEELRARAIDFLPPAVRDLVLFTSNREAIAEGVADLMAEVERGRRRIVELEIQRDTARKDARVATGRLEELLEVSSREIRRLKRREAVAARARLSFARPPWKNVQPATRALRELVADRPDLVAITDANAAFVRDTYDDLELSVYDEQTLYVTLCALGTLVEMTRNSYERGVAGGSTLGEVAVLVQTFVSALVDYLPAEAK